MSEANVSVPLSSSTRSHLYVTSSSGPKSWSTASWRVSGTVRRPGYLAAFGSWPFTRSETGLVGSATTGVTRDQSDVACPWVGLVRV